MFRFEFFGLGVYIKLVVIPYECDSNSQLEVLTRWPSMFVWMFSLPIYMGLRALSDDMRFRMFQIPTCAMGASLFETDRLKTY